jgi:menaquinone-specific isochorismate synthase
MPVISYNHNLLNNKQDIKQFILANQNYNSASSQAEIVSISKEVAAMDPLVFLATMMQPNELSFYWENQRKKEAVVAIGSVKNFQINSDNINSTASRQQDYTLRNRFIQCQEFIEYFQNKIIKIGNLELNNIPYFFAHFNFFNRQNNSDNSFPSAHIFIPYLQLIKKEKKYIIVINNLTKNQENNRQLLDTFFQDDNKHSNGYNKDSRFIKEQKSNLNRNINDSEYENFTAKVTKVLSKIRAKEISKIVVAHSLEINYQESFNVVESLANLRKNHPDCYIFSISNKQENYFIGASPERLLSIQDRQLVTDALAGSAPRGDSDFEDQFLGETLLNSEKEKREHDAVSDFIIQSLSKLELTPKKASLQLLKLSNIQHLWTPIYAYISSHLKPLEIIEQLHPTPAVAGVPIDIACEEIKRGENFDRSLYAAPLGWIDFQGNCEFIVGIRSALIQGNKARLYAGAGIVAGSDPQQELTEIKLKFQALLQALV